MLSRLAARVATGPVGFFAAGVVDVSVLWGQWAARALVARVRRLAR